MLDVKSKIKNKITKLDDFNKDEIEYVINEEISKASLLTYIDKDKKEEIKNDILDEIIGYGKIEKFINDSDVSEIMINGINDIFIEKHGQIIQTNIHLTYAEIDNIIEKIASEVNKMISIARPILDARLKDGSRVNIVGKPVALNGPIVTIRKFSKELLSASDLINNGTITSEVGEFLKYIVKNKYNIFISGGTGSGKTTLLNIMSNFIGEDERVITIEDSAELKINHIKNLVSLETRDGNINGDNKISIRDLLITSLRMRPDRIIVGEVRGSETFDMLQAMNTGHEGSLSTGHANSSRDMLTRLESMVIMAYDLPLEAIKRQIASAIDIIIHISRNSEGNRKIVEISQISGYEDGHYVMNEIYKYDYNKNEIIKMGGLIAK
ncbi:MAG: CpaF family protein [Clostridia bacterium]|nr:CpaF family protein [Clostridia bacterium]